MIHLASDFVAEKICQTVMGQEEGVRRLIRAVLQSLDCFVTGKKGKKNVLLTGPTGSGKSEVARQLGKVLKVPTVRVSITDYTLTGYKGRDPQEILLEDFRKEYRRKKAEFKKFLTKVLAYYGALNYIKELPLAERLELSRFGALLCFSEADEVEEPPKNANLLLLMLESLERDPEVQRRAEELLKGPPFGVVFVDEFDKVLIEESQYGFYQHLQSHILTMIEGGVITREKLTEMDSSNVVFVLAGSFYLAGPEELIPELKGRLQVEVNFKKLELQDYERIAKGLFLRGELPGLVGEVEVEESFFKELARVCHIENQKEYLGARRLYRLLDAVEEALNWELSKAPSEVRLTGKFLYWALNFNPPPPSLPETAVKREKRKKEALQVPELFLKFLRENEPLTVNDRNFEKYRWLLSIIDDEGKTLLLKAYEEELLQVSVSNQQFLELEVGKGKKLKDINGWFDDPLIEKVERELKEKGEETEEFPKKADDGAIYDDIDDIEF